MTIDDVIKETPWVSLGEIIATRETAALMRYKRPDKTLEYLLFITKDGRSRHVAFDEGKRDQARYASINDGADEGDVLAVLGLA